MQEILLNILGPILLLILLGALLHWKFKMDLGSLSKLNLFLFVPGFVFHNVSTSGLRAHEMAAVVLVTFMQSLLLGGIVLAAGRVFRVNPKITSALMLAAMFYNSGNFGLPLVQLTFGEADERGAAAVQTFVLMTQNVMTFTIGLMIAAWGGGDHLGRSLLSIFRLPMVPALAAGLIARWLRVEHQIAVPKILAVPSSYLAAGLVPIALVTLGAQLASNPRWPRWKPVSSILFLRVIYAPIQMAAMLFALHKLATMASAAHRGFAFANLWPWPAKSLILTAGVPTAVNTLLLTLEMDGDPELAADCVFWTTVFSCVTVTGMLAILKSWQA
jgi:hypothetical protein